MRDRNESMVIVCRSNTSVAVPALTIQIPKSRSDPSMAFLGPVIVAILVMAKVKMWC